MRILLAILATYRLAQLIHFDDGPLFIFAKMREWADKKATDEQKETRKKLGISESEYINMPRDELAILSKNYRGKMSNLSEGLHCPYCTGVWAAVICTILVKYPSKIGDFFLYLLAIAGGQSIIERNSK